VLRTCFTCLRQLSYPSKPVQPQLSGTRKQLGRRVFREESVITRRRCQTLIDLYDRYSSVVPGQDANFKPILHYYDLKDVCPNAARSMHSVAILCKRQIQEFYGLPRLFLEAVFVACLWPGDSHTPHADNERNKRGRWVPNHTPQRDFTALLYLNVEFTGGELVFPGLRIAIDPQPGLLVGFPSDHNFVHAVRKVQSGRRYSLPVWLTKDRNYAMQS
jgi:hypothetical protein